MTFLQKGVSHTAVSQNYLFEHLKGSLALPKQTEIVYMSEIALRLFYHLKQYLQNVPLGIHTECPLQIKVKEQSNFTG